MQADTLVYRNGFIASADAGHMAAAGESWPRLDLGDWHIAAHPETEVTRLDGPGGAAIAFGSVYLPERGLYDTGAAVRALAADMAQGLERFHESLDEVCGRFALLIRGPEGWRVYHDALGGRSVFYARGTAAFSSHVELLADALRLRPGDHFIPFLTSSGYRARDVKYLPGLATPYDELRQLTPNTALVPSEGRPRRYWPREDMVPLQDEEVAIAALVAHFEGLNRYLAEAGLRPYLGLTGGTDSRGLLAGLASRDPLSFTWIRSPGAKQTADKESRAAAHLAAQAGIDHSILPIKSPIRLSDADDRIGKAYRRNTGYFRGIDGGWQRHFMDVDYRRSLFVRGFGGEVLRGFYQKSKNALRRANARQLANLYDVNAGSRITRDFFDEFLELTEFSEERACGYDMHDLFYWEHRMGTWGSIALTECDLAIRGYSGYNNRALFRAFMSLDWEAREARRPIHEAVTRLAPDLGAIAYI